MNAFIIFAVVLTIAYIMYYAALITIELNTKKRAETETEEDIAADDEEEEEDTVISRTVVEAPDGGFSFALQDMFSKNNEEENASPIEENIEEAPEGIEDERQHEQQSAQDDSIHDVNEVKDNEDAVNEEEAKEEETASDEETTSLGNGTDDDLQFLDITPDTIDEEAEQEPYDASSAFDANLIQPEIGVQKIVGPQISESLRQKVDIINKSLTSVRPRGRIEMNSQKFKSWLKELKTEEKCNIAITHEQNKY